MISTQTTISNFTFCHFYLTNWAIVVAQLAERSLPSRRPRFEFCCQQFLKKNFFIVNDWKNENREKRSAIVGQFFLKKTSSKFTFTGNIRRLMPVATKEVASIALCSKTDCHCSIFTFFCLHWSFIRLDSLCSSFVNSSCSSRLELSIS